CWIIIRGSKLAPWSRWPEPRSAHRLSIRRCLPPARLRARRCDEVMISRSQEDRTAARALRDKLCCSAGIHPAEQLLQADLPHDQRTARLPGELGNRDVLDGGHRI